MEGGGERVSKFKLSVNLGRMTLAIIGPHTYFRYKLQVHLLDSDSDR